MKSRKTWQCSIVVKLWVCGVIILMTIAHFNGFSQNPVLTTSSHSHKKLSQLQKRASDIANHSHAVEDSLLQFQKVMAAPKKSHAPIKSATFHGV